MPASNPVANNYAHGSLAETIFAALSGIDTNRKLLPEDLAPIDEFHIGGRRATIDLADQLAFEPGYQLLDVGSGLGGASRYFAHERGCSVTGIDLTAEFVEVAEALAKRVGLLHKVSYLRCDATTLPFAARSFDGAYMLHVGMNVSDKVKLFGEVFRVLKSGSLFAIYDIMREQVVGDLTFPVPWASDPSMSFVESAAHYQRLLEGAGFIVERQRSRRDFAIEFFRQMQSRAVGGDNRPQLGLHILMGASASQKLTNMIKMVERGLVAPTEMICRSP